MQLHASHKIASIGVEIEKKYLFLIHSSFFPVCHFQTDFLRLSDSLCRGTKLLFDTEV